MFGFEFIDDIAGMLMAEENRFDPYTGDRSILKIFILVGCHSICKKSS